MTSITVPNLSPRGAIAGTDYMLVQPTGTGQSLETTTAAQVAAFVAAQSGGTLITPSGDTTGATDTAAIQAALNSGKNVLLAAGTFYTNADLTLNTQAQCGQRVIGAAPSDQYGLGSGATILKPTSAVTNAFRVDGTNFSGYMESVGIENLTIDMSNMLANTNAIKQLQGFDNTYSRIRVVGDGNGNGKASIYFGPGSYDTWVRDLWGGLVSITGTGSNNPTTIKFDKCDVRQFVGTQCSQITWSGGSIQPVYYSGMTKVYVASGSSTIPAGVSTAAGCYLIITGSIANSDNFTALNTDYETGAGGFPSTWNDGTHGSLNAYPVFQVGGSSFRTYLINMSFYSSYVYDTANNVNMLGANVGVGSPNYVNLFRDGTWFDQTSSVVNGNALRFYTDRASTQSARIDGSTGAATLRNIVVQPSGSGNFGVHYDPSGNTVFACYTAADGNGAHNTLFVTQAAFKFYSDQAATTQTVAVNATTGNVQSYTSTVQPGTNGANTILWNNAAGSTFFGTLSSATLTSCQLFLNNGASFIGYSDNATTQTFTVNGATGALLSLGSGGVGYATGAGGAVTQATSRTTGVTLNKATGAITLVSAAGSAAYQTFTVTNSTVAATDTIHVSQKSGTDKYILLVTAVAAGSFNITFATTGGTTTEQPVFNFTVIKGAAS